MPSIKQKYNIGRIMSENDIKISDVIPESSFTINLSTGARGVQGDKGPVGETPNIQIGSVTKGEEASATITGTRENPYLNLVLPQGTKGNSITELEIINNELIVTVENEGSSNLGQIIPEINVGVVKTINPDEEAKIVNVGTTLNPVFDFSIPRGEKGDVGDRGEPGQIEFEVVSSLPARGEVSKIYLVQETDPEEGNMYKEYIWINNDWEAIGSIGADIDLKDYIKNTDYATTSTAGIIKLGNGTTITNGVLNASIMNYNTYSGSNDNTFISKGTLENALTGKGFITSNDIPKNISYFTNDSNYLTSHQEAYKETTGNTFTTTGPTLMNVILRGNCTQDTTPNPGTPQIVKTVSDLSIKCSNGSDEAVTVVNFGGYELCKIGDYYDEVDLKRGVIIKKIDKVTFDGSETIIQRTDISNLTNTICFRSSHSLKVINNKLANAPQLSTHFQCLNNITDVEHIRYTNGTQGFEFQIFINKTRLSAQSVAGFQNWLKTNNVTIYYVLNTPIEIEIDKQIIKSVNGQNTISFISNAQPSYKKIEYYENNNVSKAISELNEKIGSVFKDIAEASEVIG